VDLSCDSHFYFPGRVCLGGDKSGTEVHHKWAVRGKRGAVPVHHEHIDIRGGGGGNQARAGGGAGAGGSGAGSVVIGPGEQFGASALTRAGGSVRSRGAVTLEPCEFATLDRTGTFFAYKSGIFRRSQTEP
jgi:hypothetical protein